jgi:hypothetical protein
VGAVVDGRAVIFDTSSINVKSLRDFARKLFPSDLLTSEMVSTESTRAHSTHCFDVDNCISFHPGSLTSIPAPFSLMKICIPVLFLQISDDNVEQFLSGWKDSGDNKGRILFFGQLVQPPVRLLIAANQLTEFYKAAYISAKSANQAALLDR